MKQIIILLTCFCFTSVLAQEGVKYNKVVYEYSSSLNNKLILQDYNLIFTNKFSVYYEKKQNTEKKKPALENDDMSNFTITYNVPFYKLILYTDFLKDSIYTQGTIISDSKKQPVIVEEKIEKIKWEIKDEYSTLNNLQVQKAVGKFRGRIYTAWFANNIPVHYGPWKLNGLPGLILKAVDENNKLSFNVKSIEIPIKSEFSKSDYEFLKGSKKISLEEYTQQYENMLKDIMEKLTSKMPRGSIMEVDINKGECLEIFE